ncbi:DUF1127 domain-containing protein [Roseixanthobacter pseudopolyaromaticivorans]|uniref:DUF1127 domain-containing protein n=1 Tax=Xanthobacteraceae TaxID=335928 RepID=UPI003727DB83
MTSLTRQITPTEKRGRSALPALGRAQGAQASARGRVARGTVRGAAAPVPDSRLAQLLGVLKVWLRRARERRELADLDDDQMRDAGISRDAARREAEKPFWRA